MGWRRAGAMGKSRPEKDGRMDDIATLEGRITAALDRIRAGLAKAEPTVAEGESPALAQQLDEERTANAQWNQWMVYIPCSDNHAIGHRC